MSEKLLGQILEQSTRAAEHSAANKQRLNDLHDQLEKHTEQDERRFDELKEGMHSVELDVQSLKTAEDIARNAGARAARRPAITWGAVIAGAVALAERVYAHLAGG